MRALLFAGITFVIGIRRQKNKAGILPGDALRLHPGASASCPPAAGREKPAVFSLLPSVCWAAGGCGKRVLWQHSHKKSYNARKALPYWAAPSALRSVWRVCGSGAAVFHAVSGGSVPHFGQRHPSAGARPGCCAGTQPAQTGGRACPALLVGPALVSAPLLFPALCAGICPVVQP